MAVGYPSRPRPGGLPGGFNPSSPAPGDSPTDGLDPTQRNAYVAIQDMLREFGLESLAPKILGFVQEGYDTNTIGYELQQTAEWKQRFIANETRKKNGLPVLSPQEYIATERSYRQIMSSAGVPSGFYDQQSDFTKFLEGDVSPAEVQSRVQSATEFVNRADPRELAAMKQFYTQGDLIAFALDPQRAAPLVGKAFQASAIAGQAGAQGLSVDKAKAEQLAGAGVSRDAAQQGFSLIAGEIGNANKLASISGEQGFTTNDLIDETFNASASVAERRKRLGEREKGRFSGGSGVTQGSLSNNSGGL